MIEFVVKREAEWKDLETLQTDHIKREKAHLGQQPKGVTK
jgi:hypothetical protein